MAMAATLYHWGLHAWAIYAVIGLITGLPIGYFLAPIIISFF